MTPLLGQLDWHGDHFLLAGFTFRLQHQAPQLHTADDAFVFFKTRDALEQFDRFLRETSFRPRRALELGIWDGGSAAFWTEALELERYAAIDKKTRGDSAYFSRWREERAAGRVTTHWGISQTDHKELLPIVADLQPLDLIIDDCSHMLAATMESFQSLFPKVRPGGYYVIEDWAWALQPAFQDPGHPWSVYGPLHPIVPRLVDLHGSRPDLISSVKVYPEFVAIERGSTQIAGRLDIRGLTARRRRPLGKIMAMRFRLLAARAKGGSERVLGRIS